MTDEPDDKQQPDPSPPEPETPAPEAGDDSAAQQEVTPDSGGDAVSVESEQPPEQSDEQSPEQSDKQSPEQSDKQSAEAEQEASEAGDDLKTVNTDDASEDDAEAAMLAMLEDLPSDSSAAKVGDIDFGSSAAKAEFQQLSEPAGETSARNIDLLMDVNLPVSIELGRTKMSISDILALGPGSVVELAKLAGEPVDVMVNYKIVARGEVVVIDENFGVRITQLMTPEERLKALGEEQ